MGLLAPGASALHSTRHREGSQELPPPRTSHSLRENSHREPTRHFLSPNWIHLDSPRSRHWGRSCKRTTEGVACAGPRLGGRGESSQLQGGSSPLDRDGRQEEGRQGRKHVRFSAVLRNSARPKENLRQVGRTQGPAPAEMAWPWNPCSQEKQGLRWTQRATLWAVSQPAPAPGSS